MESKITSENILPPNFIQSQRGHCQLAIKLQYYHQILHANESTRITILITLLQISFFLNGHPAGVAFSDVYFGEYFPAISIYGRSTLRCNFGPTFKCPPKIEGRKFVSQA